jgi:hypothetical protein
MQFVDRAQRNLRAHCESTADLHSRTGTFFHGITPHLATHDRQGIHSCPFYIPTHPIIVSHRFAGHSEIPVRSFCELHRTAYPRRGVLALIRDCLKHTFWRSMSHSAVFKYSTTAKTTPSSNTSDRLSASTIRARRR